MTACLRLHPPHPPHPSYPPSDLLIPFPPRARDDCAQAKQIVARDPDDPHWIAFTIAEAAWIPILVDAKMTEHFAAQEVAIDSGKEDLKVAEEWVSKAEQHLHTWVVRGILRSEKRAAHFRALGRGWIFIQLSAQKATSGGHWTSGESTRPGPSSHLSYCTCLPSPMPVPLGQPTSRPPCPPVLRPIRIGRQPTSARAISHASSGGSRAPTACCATGRTSSPRCGSSPRTCPSGSPATCKAPSWSSCCVGWSTQSR